MQPSPNIEVLFDLFQTIQLFLSRTTVLRQLLAIGGGIVIAWFLSKGLIGLVNQRLLNSVELKKKSYLQLIEILNRDMTFPLLGIIILYLSQSQFERIGWLTGLFGHTIFLLWLFLAYRVLIALLYRMFSKKIVDRYDYRLFGPLFVLFLFLYLLNQIINVQKLAEVILIVLFSNPITIGALFIATVGLYFWIDTAWGIQDLLQQFLNSYTDFDPGVVQAALTIWRYVMMIIGLIIVFGSLGLDGSTVAAIATGLSAGIGFALKDVLNNFIGGILLLFEGSVHPGDVVSIDGEIGVIDHLSIRSTTVRTLDDVEIIVPNEIFLTSTITNYTKTTRAIRLIIPVGASYDSDPKEVFEALLTVANQHKRVFSRADPRASLVNFGDSSLDFELKVWIDEAKHKKEVTEELNLMIWEEFAKRNIEMPYPQRDLHIRSGIENLKEVE